MAIVSSHTLNGVDGTHAGGIAVRLVNLSTGIEVFLTTMDRGGRLSEKVDISDADSGDRYEITFATALYWEKFEHLSQGAQIMDEVVLRFSMPDPDARYHMPLILSPNSYSTWWSIPE